MDDRLRFDAVAASGRDRFEQRSGAAVTRLGRTVFGALLAIFAAAPAAAQDIRGLEVCSAEKDMARRTGCLQSNVEFLQKELARQARDARNRDAAYARDIAALNADVASLKTALANVESELAALKKAQPQGAPAKQAAPEKKDK